MCDSQTKLDEKLWLQIEHNIANRTSTIQFNFFAIEKI